MNHLRACRRLWIASLMFWLSATSPGADFVPPQNPPRFLFIVEKSEATEALRLDLSQTMFDLIYRGANGRMADGSVFEIWVFGAETTYRGFAPQMLTPNNHLPLASRASAYVRSVPGAGTADVPKLVEHLHGASELGQELTIVLVTAPDTRLSGTRRDAEINGFLDAHAEAQREARRPFITSMRIQDGQLVAATVSDSPFTMTMPEMPASALTPEERMKRIDAARKARQEREQPAVVETPAPTSTPPATATVPPKRNTGIPDEEWEGAIIIKGSPRPAQPAADVPAGNAGTTTTTATTTSTPDRTASSPGPETQSPAASADPGAAGVSETSKVATPTVTNGAPGGGTADAGGTTAPPVTSPSNTVASAAGTPPANPTPAAAAAVPATTWLTAGGLFVAGLCFFVVAGLLAWVLMRRTRAASGPSYITRSLEHRRD